MGLAAVILGAGLGTRMKSNLPKVLHPVAGKPMVCYSMDTASALGADRIVLVVGHGSELVRQQVGDRAIFVEQNELRGTGHAVLQAREALRGQADTVMVTYADMPLLAPATLKSLIDLHTAAHATITMTAVITEQKMPYGRVLRDRDRRIMGLVEEADATPEQAAIRELNVGAYCFDAAWLWDRLTQIKPNNKKNEYYLTDLVAIAVQENRPIESFALQEVTEAIGVNTRAQLAQAEQAMRRRINEAQMLAGVTLVDPATTYIEADVVIGMDTIVEPNTHLTGKTRIGADCHIGPNSIIRDSQIGEHCQVLASVIEASIIEDHVEMGPFCHLRPGAHLASHVHMGNFGEVKNSYVGEGTHMGHFSYIGDAQLGTHVNVGAGTITCNYDGKKKHRTVIGDNAFIGSDTMLRAPVAVGDRAVTGAGSVVTKDVPADSVAVGVPARVIRKVNRT